MVLVSSSYWSLDELETENLQGKTAASGGVTEARAAKTEPQAASMYLLANHADLHSNFRTLKGTNLLKQQHIMEGY